MKVNDILSVDPKTLYPTQFCLGFKEIEHKEKLITDMDEKSYEKYLIKKITPVVIGPGNKLYLIDHHHHARSLINLGKDRIVIKIIRDHSQLTFPNFIKQMQHDKFVNLLDEQNQPQTFLKLPSSLLDMRHDYYRSLAWSVREKDGFKKVDEIPFFEFRWGEFFRLYLTEQLIKNHFDLATDVAVKLARSDEAKHLPGFLKTP